MALQTKPTAQGSKFSGFTEEGFRFLKGLAKNNDREWFLPRKAVFEKELQEPAKQLLLAVEAQMKKSDVPLRTKEKGMLSRIYRDIRFSANKAPYHTHISGSLHHYGKKDAPGVLYIHIADKESFLGIGFWQPERPLLTQWRSKMQDDPRAFLNMVKQLNKKNLALEESHRLQRMPRGFEAAEGSPIGEYLRFQSFIIVRPLPKTETMSAKLPEIVAHAALDAKPLLEYGWSIPKVDSKAFFE